MIMKHESILVVMRQTVNYDICLSITYTQIENMSFLENEVEKCVFLSILRIIISSQRLFLI